jgi:hypothetical protein
LASIVRPAGSRQAKRSRTDRQVSSLTQGSPGVACGSTHAPKLTVAPIAVKPTLS